MEKSQNHPCEHCGHDTHTHVICATQCDECRDKKALLKKIEADELDRMNNLSTSAMRAEVAEWFGENAGDDIDTVEPSKLIADYMTDYMRWNNDKSIEELHEMITTTITLNVVTCGDCGEVFAHKIKIGDELTCPYCKFTDDISSFPDLWYDNGLDSIIKITR